MKFARNMSEKLFFPTLFFTFNLRAHHPRNQWEDKFLSFVTVEAKVGSIEGSKAQISRCNYLKATNQDWDLETLYFFRAENVYAHLYLLWYLMNIKLPMDLPLLVQTGRKVNWTMKWGGLPIWSEEIWKKVLTRKHRKKFFMLSLKTSGT